MNLNIQKYTKDNNKRLATTELKRRDRDVKCILCNKN